MLVSDHIGIVHYTINLYVLYDTEEDRYTLESQILPFDPSNEDRFRIVHRLGLEVRNGFYDLGRFIYQLQYESAFRHLPVEAYERWLRMDDHRFPRLSIEWGIIL